MSHCANKLKVKICLPSFPLSFMKNSFIINPLVPLQSQLFSVFMVSYGVLIEMKIKSFHSLRLLTEWFYPKQEKYHKMSMVVCGQVQLKETDVNKAAAQIIIWISITTLTHSDWSKQGHFPHYCWLWNHCQPVRSMAGASSPRSSVLARFCASQLSCSIQRWEWQICFISLLGNHLGVWDGIWVLSFALSAFMVLP